MEGYPDDRVTDRSAHWLPLLRRLTELSPDWIVWKNADRALGEDGDVDSVAPRPLWPAVEDLFRGWASDNALGPVGVCRHFANVPIFVAVPPGEPTLLELDVRTGKVWRGASLFTLEDLRPLAEIDPRGFRRVRPGAEGLFKLLLNGVRGTGGPDWPALREKRVAELLRADPEGARLAAGLLGWASGPAIRAAERVAAGGWDRPAMTGVMAWALAGAGRDPGVFAQRVRFRAELSKTVARCPLLTTIWYHDRRIPADRAEWLSRVAAAHREVGAA